jgi:membrane-associated phospholipid phosphatase
MVSFYCILAEKYLRALSLRWVTIKSVAISKLKPAQYIGIIGALTCLALFAKQPSFPTPDKLLLFLVFIFMVFRQAVAMLRHIAPFVLVLLAYESFRSVADQLNHHVNYSLAPHIDRLLFGNLPTLYLQHWLWHGHVSWYDFVFYLAYMLHFIVPLALAILIWKTREKFYWQVVSTYLIVAFAAFITFWLLPAAPPWLASQNHFIQPISRISSSVWFALGLHDFPSFYNHISPNPVAAIPSLHAAWALLLSLFVFRFYGWRWAAVSAIYPLLIFVGTVYQGEHYAFDILAGALYAVAAFLLVPKLITSLKKPHLAAKILHLPQ